MAWSFELIVRALAALGTGALYVYVGRLVLARSLPAEARRANVAFATWWWSFGIVEFLLAAYLLPAALGLRDLALAVTLINILLVLYAVAVGGLFYYLVFLYTGSSRAFWPVVLAYGAFALGLLYLVAWMQPMGFDDSTGLASLTFTRELQGAPTIVLGLAFSLPVVLAALGYGSLYWRTREPTPRFRIAVVALSFMGWFGWSATSSALQLSARFPSSRILLFVNSGIALAAALLVVAAYRPPRWIVRRLEERRAAFS